MTAKEKLRRAVEDLSEGEAQAALAFIHEKHGESDPVLQHFELALEDDEPTTLEEDQAAAEAWAGYERGESVPLEQVRADQD